MKPLTQSQIQPIVEMENNHSARSEFPTDQTLDAQVYRSNFQEWNGRKAEGYARMGEVNPLLEIRALLMRGCLAEADQLITSVKVGTTEPGPRIEVLLEESRLASLYGDWNRYLLVAQEALRLLPTPISRMTLHQLCSVAFYEMGDLSKSLDELQRIESLAEVLPNCLSGIYARIFQTKIIARDQGFIHGRAYLDHLWQMFIGSGRLNGDLTLTLMRMEVDLARSSRQTHLQWAVASFLIADAIGDELFKGLALIDCFYASDDEGQKTLSPMKLRFEERFERVRILCREVESQGQKSLTAQSIAQFHQKGSQQSIRNFESLLTCPPRTLVIPKLSLVIEHRPFVFTCQPGRTQLFEAVSLLAAGSLSKELFFHSLWGEQKYSSHLHDTLIRSLLYKVRKYLGVETAMNDGNVGLSQTLVLGEMK